MNRNKLFKKTITNYSQLLAQVFIALLCTNAYAQNAAMPQKAYTQRGPIVLELFTSTKCPACPPADANMEALFGRPDMITISCHVTYFDRPPKKDMYSQKFCDARQSIYKLVLHTKQVFTPMMVVDGQNFLKGNDRQDLKNALVRTGKEHVNKPIALNIKGQYMEVRLPEVRLDNGAAEVWLIEYLPKTSEGLSGAVTNMTKLMNWDGNAYTLGSPINKGRDYAVIAQNYKTGIVASGKTH